ncbi:MAG: hypothetical protein CM1200mP39_16100 [Dehalococcoidia bacterium]|nr:MAG: hypothetical protein CM1200mP39_16100 [Dehalococcoidia bacterium]
MLGRSMQYESLKHFDQDTFFFELPIDTAMEKVSNTHPYYKGVMEHEQYDEWWSSYSLRDKYSEMAIPSLFITGWFDSLSNENFKLFNGWTKKAKTQDARSKTKLIIGPWSHQIAPGAEYPWVKMANTLIAPLEKALSGVIEMHMHLG